MCFVAVQAVQVGVVLDGPAAATQVAQDVAWQAGAEKRVGVADG